MKNESLPVLIAAALAMLLALTLSGCRSALADEPATVADAVVTAPTDDISSIGDGVRKVAQDWGDLGALAGLVAAVTLLTRLTKIPLLARFIPVSARPWIATGLGVVGGFLSGLANGGGWLQALISGALAGVGAIGIDQLGSTATPGGRAKKEAAAAVASALEGPTVEVKARAEALSAELATIGTLPDKTSRLEALAAAATRSMNGAR